MTLQEPFPTRLTEIDDLTRSDHSNLEESDVCYFLGEYTARAGYSYSATNNLISNFKISLEPQNQHRRRHKEGAITEAAAAFAQAINTEALESATLVPIPPSKAKDHPHYDDRLVRMLQRIAPEANLDIREIIVQAESTDPAHHADANERPNPQDLTQIYRLDERLLGPPRSRLVIFDDVLTTGAHFVAARRLLQGAFPDTPIIGTFIARVERRAVFDFGQAT